MNQNDISPGKKIDADETRLHFMRVVSEINNIACLFEQNEDGSLSAVLVTPAFTAMMECDTREEALQLMDGEGLFRNTHEEDRPLLQNMLKNKAGEDGRQDLTIRKITKKGNIIWCTVHFAFIDEYDRHYVYCTFIDVTRLKRYEEQLQSVYTSLGKTFHQTENDSLLQIRVNLTRNVVEEGNISSDFVPGYENMTFDETK